MTQDPQQAPKHPDPKPFAAVSRLVLASAAALLASCHMLPLGQNRDKVDVPPASTVTFEPTGDQKPLPQSTPPSPSEIKLFPGHGNLLPAYFDSPNGMFEYVRKPLLSREGANITVHTMKEHLESSGDYGAEGFVFQELAPIPEFGGRRPVIGSWVVGQEAAGMGIRESDGWVTGNTSRLTLMRPESRRCEAHKTT